MNIKIFFKVNDREVYEHFLKGYPKYKFETIYLNSEWSSNFIV